MENPAFSLLCTKRTAIEADLLMSALRSAGFHPVDFASSSHFSIAGVDISYPIKLPTGELAEAKSFLESFEAAIVPADRDGKADKKL